MKKIRKYFQIIIDSPWKLVNEAFMYFLKLPAFFYVALVGVKVGKGFKFYGLPKFYRYRGSRITIGDRFEDRNLWYTNPLGINHPTIICTWSKNAHIKIGNDVGISGGSIVAAEKIEIGDGTIIGANSTIIDTDFHPIISSQRRYAINNIRSRSVVIGKNVFIGMNCIILRGSVIPNDSVIPAGSIVRSNLSTKYNK